MNRLLIIGITFLLTIVFTRLSGQPWNQELAQQDFDLLVAALAEIHPALERYRTEGSFQESIKSSKKKASDATDPFSFFQSIAHLVATINCGHTQISPSPQLTRFLQQKGKFLPIIPYVIDSSLYVYLNGTQQASPLEGQEILSINGIPSSRLIQDLLSHLPSDGASS